MPRVRVGVGLGLALGLGLGLGLHKNVNNVITISPIWLKFCVRLFGTIIHKIRKSFTV